MHLSILDYVHWGVGTAFEVFVCVLALRRGLFRRLPFLTIYLLLLIAREAIWFVAYHVLDPTSPVLLFLYWIMQAILLVARGTVVAEICWRVLAPYPGVWGLCRRILLGIAGILIVTAAWAAHRNVPKLPAVVLTAERGLELVVVGILVFALAFCRHYNLKIQPPIPLVALGLGLYSAIQVANNTFFQGQHGWQFTLWSAVRHVSFDLTLIAWCAALWKPLPALEPAPALLESGEYETIAPQLNAGLRELNTRLLEMLK
jgi:hypothetical protein